MSRPAELEGADNDETPTNKEFVMNDQVKIADEMRKMEYEPLLPVEKKLIGYSIGIGIILLGILIFISYEFFPG